MKLKIVLAIILISHFFVVDAQTVKDSLLNVEDFYDLVKEHHPIAKGANLIAARAEFEIMEAKGMFDPKLVSEYNNKQFADKRYYETWNSYLNLPTQLNVDFKAGYERNSGVFINPESNTPTTGLYYAGISIPLGQGLLASARNIELKKSKIAGVGLENDAKIVLNNLLLDANFTYWFWFESYQKKELVASSLSTITIRYDGIRQAVLNEEIAIIDSVEALIQVQQWTNNLKKAELELANSKLLLNNFIWGNSVVTDSLFPIASEANDLLALNNYQSASFQHPELESIRLKNASLILDQRMFREQLKPKLNLNYNFLLSEQSTNIEHSFLSNNYKAGIDFEMPLLLRKERAKLKSVGLKQQENQFKLNYKMREITNKIIQYYNKCITLNDMINEQLRMVGNYERLLEGERIKFNNGESSIFLVNSRENKRITAEIKLIELLADYGRALGQLQWSSSLFVQDLNN